MFCQLFSLQNKSFLCLQHVENKGFQTVIKHRLKAIQKPIKNELGNREKNTKNAHFVLKKCTFRFRDYNIRTRIFPLDILINIMLKLILHLLSSEGQLVKWEYVVKDIGLLMIVLSLHAMIFTRNTYTMFCFLTKVIFCIM